MNVDARDPRAVAAMYAHLKSLLLAGRDEEYQRDKQAALTELHFLGETIGTAQILHDKLSRLEDQRRKAAAADEQRARSSCCALWRCFT